MINIKDLTEHMITDRLNGACNGLAHTKVCHFMISD